MRTEVQIIPVSSVMNLRVADVEARYDKWSAKRAAFMIYLARRPGARPSLRNRRCLLGDAH
jgi:hypothetical protein